MFINNPFETILLMQHIHTFIENGLKTIRGKPILYVGNYEYNIINNIMGNTENRMQDVPVELIKIWDAGFVLVNGDLHTAQDAINLGQVITAGWAERASISLASEYSLKMLETQGLVFSSDLPPNKLN